ncbi:hypothetical protein H4S06_003042, partial [Coemansia sp. BCRC 34490]
RWAEKTFGVVAQTIQIITPLQMETVYSTPTNLKLDNRRLRSAPARAGLDDTASRKSIF